MVDRVTLRQMRHIPPSLRGAARAICDVDPTQLPELYDSDRARFGQWQTVRQQGAPRRGAAPATDELRWLTTAINDNVPLSTQEFRLFRAAYAECRRHLRGVPAEVMSAGTPVSAVLARTTRVDALCTELGITLTEAFPQLNEVHTFMLALAEGGDGCGGGSVNGIAGSGGSSSSIHTNGAGAAANSDQLLIEGIMLHFLSSLLDRAITALLVFADSQRAYRQLRSGGRDLRTLGGLDNSAITDNNTTAAGQRLHPRSDRLPQVVTSHTRPPLFTDQRQQRQASLVHLQGRWHSEQDGVRGEAIVASATAAVTGSFSPAFGASRDGDGDGSPISPRPTLMPGSHTTTTTTTRVGAADSSLDTGRWEDVRADSHAGGDGDTEEVEEQEEEVEQLEKSSGEWRSPLRAVSGAKRRGVAALPAMTTAPVGGNASTLAVTRATATVAAATLAPTQPASLLGDAAYASRTLAANGGGTLPDVADAISGVNADIRSHLAHLRWLVQVTRSSDFTSFNSDDHLDDASMQKVWSMYIGSSRPACTADVFAASQLLSIFPSWLHAPMLEVLNFKQCGVISLFTVQRLLKVWGPSLLLDRNLQDDVRSGVLELTEPFLYVADTLAHRPDAQAGDFVVSLTEVPGEVRITVLRPAGRGSTAGGLPSPPNHRIGQSRAVLYSSASPSQVQPHPVGVGCMESTQRGWSIQANNGETSGSGAGGYPESVIGIGGARHGRRRTRLMSTASYNDQQHQQHYLHPSNGRSHDGGGGGCGPICSPTCNTSTSLSGSSLGHAAPPLRAFSYPLSQESGAWSVQGLTKEEFESIAEACRSFPDVFRRARGKAAHPSRTDSTGGGGESGGSGSGTDAGDGVGIRVRESNSFAHLQQQQLQEQLRREGGAANSGLHRACFRNNKRYVRTLLSRGAGTVVNTAVTDPAVSNNFCWTPLLCAVNNPNADPAEVVDLLLRAGAQADYEDDAECTALYYAVANGYAASARLLLEHCPTLFTSKETNPLLIALGAHHYLLCERDVRRLTDVVPSPAMMETVSAHVHDYQFCLLAVTILQDKLNGQDTQRDGDTMREMVMAHCPVGPHVEEPHTKEEQAMLARLVRYHTNLCRSFDHATRRALKVLRDRCYLLSWRAYLAQPVSVVVTPTVAAVNTAGDSSAAEMILSPAAVEYTVETNRVLHLEADTV